MLKIKFNQLIMGPLLNNFILKFINFSKIFFSLAGFSLMSTIVECKEQILFKSIKVYVYFVFNDKHEFIAGPLRSHSLLTDAQVLAYYRKNYDIKFDLAAILQTIEIHFSELIDFISKSKYVARVWDIFYLCPLAPETFCFIFALYNVLKASLLYYYYSQVTHNISNPILVKGISLSMAKTIYIQLQIVLLLFINPVIFDRVMVMCNGLIMSHGFISAFKIFSVFLFRIIIVYILEFGKKVYFLLLIIHLNYIFSI